MKNYIFLIVIVGFWSADIQCMDTLGELIPARTSSASGSPFPFVAVCKDGEDEAEIVQNGEVVLFKSASPVTAQSPTQKKGYVSPELWKQAFGMSFAIKSKHLCPKRR